MSAAFFALVLSVIPPAGLNVVDPDAVRTGFELLAKTALRFADWKTVCGSLVPLLVLGGVLGYARWRTASLWMPVGLHAGWLFGREMLTNLCQSKWIPGNAHGIGAGAFLQQSLVPLAAILLAGVLVHRFTANHHDENAASL